jgi:cytochrome c peroxidase
MHDGSIATLEEVVEFYNRGGVKNPHLDPVMQPLELKKDEMGDLVAFLRTLSTGRTPDRPPQLKK